MQSKPQNFDDKMSRISEVELIKAKLLVDYAGALKNQIIFIDPKTYELLHKSGIVGDKEDVTNGNL